MKALAYIVWFASVIALASAQESRKTSSAVRGLSPADDAAIRAVHEVYRRSAIEGAWERWAATLTDDAVMMPPNGPAVVGRANIEKWGRALPRMKGFENPVLELEGAGDFAIMRGNFTLRWEIPGQADLPDAGKFMVTWRRQRDGTWKFDRGIFNSDLPLPAASGEASGLPAAVVVPPGSDPWIGRWVLNVDKTRINPGPKLQSEIRTYAAAGESEIATYDTVEADGKKVFSTSTYKFDGKDSLLVGDLKEDTMALTRTNPRTISAVIKKGGKVIRTATREVSADGATLTVEFKGTNSRGQQIVEEVWVFDRQTAASANEVAATAVKAAVVGHWNAINGKDTAAVNAQHMPEQLVFLADVENRMALSSPAWLAMVRRWEGSKFNWNVRDLHVQPLGTMAVATFYLDGSTVTADGATDARSRRVTEVWVNAGGTWKEAHHHDSVASPLQKAAR